jgi:hypothetical protein
MTTVRPLLLVRMLHKDALVHREVAGVIDLMRDSIAVQGLDVLFRVTVVLQRAAVIRTTWGRTTVLNLVTKLKAMMGALMLRAVLHGKVNSLMEIGGLAAVVVVAVVALMVRSEVMDQAVLTVPLDLMAQTALTAPVAMTGRDVEILDDSRTDLVPKEIAAEATILAMMATEAVEAVVVAAVEMTVAAGDATTADHHEVGATPVEVAIMVCRDVAGQFRHPARWLKEHLKEFWNSTHVVMDSFATQNETTPRKIPIRSSPVRWLKNTNCVQAF